MLFGQVLLVVLGMGDAKIAFGITIYESNTVRRWAAQSSTVHAGPL